MHTFAFFAFLKHVRMRECVWPLKRANLMSGGLSNSLRERRKMKKAAIKEMTSTQKWKEERERKRESQGYGRISCKRRRRRRNIFCPPTRMGKETTFFLPKLRAGFFEAFSFPFKRLLGNYETGFIPTTNTRVFWIFFNKVRWKVVQWTEVRKIVLNFACLS